MADIKFSCPQCAQNITCDELWMGQQIACPSCQTPLIVPQMAPAPVAIAPEPAQPTTSESLVPTPPTTTRLSINRTQHTAHTPAAPPPDRATPVYRTFTPEPMEKSGGAMKVVKIVVLLALLGVGGYFGFKWLLDVQAKTNAKLAEEAKNSDGGEACDIAGVYQMLDVTDPDHPGVSSKELAKEKRRDVAMAESLANRGKPDPNLPTIPPAWTLDSGAAKIPESRVNGTIHGTNFVASTIQFDVASDAEVLRFIQGDVLSPDREVLIYLHLKSNETLAGKSYTIAADAKGPANPGVVKRWKTNPKYAPTSKSFSTGYVLKLEFGPMKDEEISGRVFVALPDAEKTVIAGVFKVEVISE